jgi:putative ABC transport system permease protein
MMHQPPKFTAWLMKRLLDPVIKDYALGDFEERFHAFAQERGLKAARAFYRRQVLLLLPAGLKTSMNWNLDILNNSFKIAFRILKRHKGFAAINLGGLALGLAACLLIGLYVQQELAFDRFHANKDRIYRLGHGSVGWPYGRILETDFPEVERVVYMRAYPTYSIEYEKHHFFEDMLYADSGFFQVFDFPLLNGDPKTALEEPYSIVLSERLAHKLFGEDPAIGRVLTLRDYLQFTVRGVVQVPRQSHIRFDALLSFETLHAIDPDGFETEMATGWLDLNVVNYIMLREGIDAETFEAKIRDLPRKHAQSYLDRWGAKYQLALEPLSRIYLRSPYGNMLGPKSDIDYVYLLSFVGLFLLIIAGANFINLATARSLNRAKEVGVRKVVGSSRNALIKQFLSESLLTCLFSGILAVGLAALALPYFNGLAARSFTARDLFTPQTLALSLGLVLAMGILAGLYPALSLSAYPPCQVLKGRFISAQRGLRLRQGLVVFQFFISGTLILATFIVLGQLRFMQQQDLGFDSQQVIVLDARRAPRQELTRMGSSFKLALASYAAVESVSSTAAVPGLNGWRGQISFPEGWPEGQSMSLEYVPVDFDFIDTLGLKVIAGRNFDASFAADKDNAVIINESAVHDVGWLSPEQSIGKKFASPGSRKPEGVVIGVVENYHHHGLQERIGPMMFGIRSGNGLFALRIDTRQASSVVSHLSRTWNRFFEGYPFDFFFLNEEFGREYEQEQRLMQIFGTFTFLTIFIACMGLFGLTAYTAAQRTKEIGVRKVLGASLMDIAALLSKDFLKLVFFAFLVAAPLGYYAMRYWLENFAYRTPIRIEVFLLSGALLMFIALGTVSYQAIKSALADPVKSLRYE